MPTQAEKLVSKPSREIKDLLAEIQDVANQTQSYAYRFEHQDDGSSIELRAAAEPRIKADTPPDARAQLEGLLCATKDDLLICLPDGDGGYGWVQASADVRKFAEFCGPGQSKLVAHIAADLIEPF